MQTATFKLRFAPHWLSSHELRTRPCQSAKLRVLECNMNATPSVPWQATSASEKQSAFGFSQRPKFHIQISWWKFLHTVRSTHIFISRFGIHNRSVHALVQDTGTQKHKAEGNHFQFYLSTHHTDVCFCQRGNELSDSIKYGKMLHHVSVQRATF